MAFQTGIKVEGTKEVARAMRYIDKQTHRRVRAELLKGGQRIYRDSQKHVPIDTGNLAGSGFVRFDRDNDEVVLVGYEASYALLVHEAIEREWKRPGATAKYLENAFNKYAKDTIDRVRRRLKGLLR